MQEETDCFRFESDMYDNECTSLGQNHTAVLSFLCYFAGYWIAQHCLKKVFDTIDNLVDCGHDITFVKETMFKYFNVSIPSKLHFYELSCESQPSLSDSDSYVYPHCLSNICHLSCCCPSAFLSELTTHRVLIWFIYNLTRWKTGHTFSKYSQISPKYVAREGACLVVVNYIGKNTPDPSSLGVIITWYTVKCGKNAPA